MHIAFLLTPLQSDMDIVMSYDNLMRLQNGAEILAPILLLGGLVFLIAGMIRPSWVRFSKRLWIVPLTLLIWIAAIAVYGGTIFFTHSQPNGPHSFFAYMDASTAMMCIKKPDLESCAKLKEKCELRDPTHPPCRILAGDDPRKYYSNTTTRSQKP